MQLDRTKIPEIKPIQELRFSNPENYNFKNGRKLYFFNNSNYEIIKLDIIVRAGSSYAENPALAVLCAKLMSEGTEKYSGEKIAEAMDYFGAALSVRNTKDFALVNLTFLKKYAQDVLPYLQEIMFHANFPEDELEVAKNKQIQEMTINEQRVGYVARNRFPSLLFGSEHPYGKPQEINHFAEVSRDELLDFYHNHFIDSDYEIVLSGPVDAELISTLESIFGNSKIEKHSKKVFPSISFTPGISQEIKMENTVQTAIRIGRHWVERTHPDYAGLKILNTVFGGYFGSRLMMNIREDKGYTYGIGSGLGISEHAAYMFISTEVNAENSQNALDEIYKEMALLTEQEISAKELQTVKTVSMGAILKAFDGPFVQADRFIELRMNDLDFSFYTKYVKQFNSVSTSDVLALANKYFVKDDFVQLTVG